MVPFTVSDLHDLLKLLHERPEWRDEVRRAVLTEELLGLPQVVRELADEVKALAEAQRRTEARLEALAEAQRRTEEEIRRLAAAQERFQAALDRFQEAQDTFQRTQDRFAQVVGGTAESRMMIAIDMLVRERGWRLLGHIESLALDGETEMDGVVRLARPDGVYWVLASAKVRVGRNDILAFAGLLSQLRVRELLRKEGVAGKVLPIVFGLLVRRGAVETAESSRVGLLLEHQGFIVEPQAWEL